MNFLSDLRVTRHVGVVAVHQVSVRDGPLLGHQSQRRQEVVVTVRQRVPPLIDRLLVLPLVLHHHPRVFLDENFALLFSASTSSSPPLADVNEEHEGAAGDYEDDADVDVGLAAETHVNRGVCDDTE